MNTILVVDDKLDNIKLLHDFLVKEGGFKVLVANDGKDAIKTTEFAQPDLILLDVMMPGMDGFEVCHILKKQEETKNIPVIFMTARSDTADKLKGFKLGAADYLTKPFKQEEVLARVTTHLKLREVQQQLILQNQQLVNEINCRKQMEVTLVKRTNELSMTNAKLAEMVHFKNEFLASMSHEIRTPMNAVIGFSELLSSIITDQKQKDYLQAIQTAGKTLLTLIDDILDFSKIEAGQLKIQYESVNPYTLFNELKQIFGIKIKQKKLDFIIDVDKNLPRALILDEVRLRQILLNLVSNAVKFTDKGYIKLSAKKIYKVADHSKVDFIILVEDTGIGIPKEQQEIIFESFRQQNGQSTRKYGGTGLGLAITKRLIEMMNGQILVRSTWGVGSIFEIILRDVGVSTTEVSVDAKETFNVKNISFEKAQVLVVDDIEFNRNLIKEWLSQTNLECLEAINGQNALFLAKESHPNVILMDMRMPVMDGYDATKELKANPSTQKIPVIALTASATMEEKLEIENTNDFSGYLSKPVNIRDLFEELCKYLKHTKKIVPTTKTVTQIDTLQNLSPESIAKLPELIEILKTEVMSVWKNMDGVVEMDVIEEFTENILKLGKHYQVEVLINYAKNLRDTVHTFDIIDIENKLQEFPDLLEYLVKIQ